MPRSRYNPKDQMDDMKTWMDDAACRQGQGTEPRIFETILANRVTHIDADVEKAREVCASCPVMMQCLNHAVRFDIDHGVWGGMLVEEREAWAARELAPAV